MIETFGTHVMVGLFTGARLDYNLAVYDYECPWGCCWVKTSVSVAPAQYLGYVRY